MEQAAAAVAKLRESAAWPGDARVALFAEPAVLRALAAEARGAFDVVQRHDAAAVGLELRGRSPAFRAKALKILAMARAPSSVASTQHARWSEWSERLLELLPPLST